MPAQIMRAEQVDGVIASAHRNQQPRKHSLGTRERTPRAPRDERQRHREIRRETPLGEAENVARQRREDHAMSRRIEQLREPRTNSRREEIVGRREQELESHDRDEADHETGERPFYFSAADMKSTHDAENSREEQAFI